MDKDKEMEALLSEKEIVINDKQVIVKRIALLDTIRLTSNLSSIVASVLSNDRTFNLAVGKILYSAGEGESEEDVNNIRALGVVELIGLIGDDGVDLLKSLIMKSTNLSLADVEHLDCLDGIDVLSAIYEVNKGFFKKFIGKLREKMEKINKTVEKKTK